jgi:hypothetical protein
MRTLRSARLPIRLEPISRAGRGRLRSEAELVGIVRLM